MEGLDQPEEVPGFKSISDRPLGKILQPFQQKGVKLQLAKMKKSELEKLNLRRPARL